MKNMWKSMQIGDRWVLMKMTFEMDGLSVEVVPDIRKELYLQMLDAADNDEFELAADLRNQLSQLDYEKV